MARTAKIERKTGETQVSLELDLDGGAVEAATGVGFLDHMLDLLGRHGRLGLKVEASGDLETGAHHTVEDVGIVLGQALDEALGDRAGIRRYGYVAVPMDESLGMCAIDISGRPLCLFEADLPPVSIAGFDTELAEEFFRAVANNARITLHVGHPLRLQRPPHDRGVLQGVRAGAARGRLDRPGRDRRAVHEGHADVTGSRSSTTGWATCARSRRRSSTWTCAPRSPTTTTGARDADGVILPGRRRLPEGDGAHSRARPRRADRASGSRPACRCWASASGMQLIFSASTELGGADGLGLVEGPVSELEADGRKVPHIGWSPVTWAKESPPDRGPCRRRAVLLRPLVRAPAHRPPRTSSAPPSTARRSPARSSAGTCLASSSTPRSRAPRACACCATSPAICAVRPGLILYPAIDIREGRAVRLMQGDYDARDRVRRGSGGRRRALGRGRRGVAARRRPRRRSLGRVAQPRARAPDRRRGRAAAAARRRPSRRRRGGRGARRRGGARRDRNRRARGDPTFLDDDARPPRPAGRGGRRRPGRHGRRRGLGRDLGRARARR